MIASISLSHVDMEKKKLIIKYLLNIERYVTVNGVNSNNEKVGISVNVATLMLQLIRRIHQ
jgi:hypothetical protein